MAQRLDHSRASTTGDIIRAKAAEAMEQGRNTAQTVTIGTKQYYVVYIKDGKLKELPQVEKVKELAKVVIRGHTRPETLDDKTIDYIDTHGAHFVDDPDGKQAHIDTPVYQEHLHTATEGVPEDRVVPEDFAEDNEDVQRDCQLTKPQVAIHALRATITDLENTEDPVLTVKNLKDELAKPNLPKEFIDMLNTLTAEKNEEDNIPFEDFDDAFDAAYYGKAFAEAPWDSDESVGGYVGRIMNEHISGTKAEHHDKFKADVKAELKMRADELETGSDTELYSLNKLMSEQRTAQHAWNAMEALAGHVHHAVEDHDLPPNLTGFGFVSVDKPVVDEDLDLDGIHVAPLKEAANILLQKALVSEATKLGLLEGLEPDAVEALTTPDLQGRINHHKLLSEAVNLGLLRWESPEAIHALTTEALQDMLTPENLKAKAIELGYIKEDDNPDLQDLKMMLFIENLSNEAQDLGLLDPKIKDPTIKQLREMLTPENLKAKAIELELIEEETELTPKQIREMVIRKTLTDEALKLKLIEEDVNPAIAELRELIDKHFIEARMAEPPSPDVVKDKAPMLGGYLSPTDWWQWGRGTGRHAKKEL